MKMMKEMMVMPRFVSSLLCVTVTLLAAAVVQAQPGDNSTMTNGTMTAMNETMPAVNGTMTGDMGLNVTEPVASLEEIIMSEPDLSTLAVAVNASDLFAEVLDSDGYYTFFAPDDTAFKGVSADLITKLLTPGFVLHLRNLLGYHVTTATPERVLSSDLMDGMVLEMLNGENVTIATEGGGVSVVDGFGTSSTVTSADQVATDGNLHIIDGLLSPAFFSTDLIKLATQYDQFSILAALMKASGADKSVPGDQDFTILAPNDAAFEKLGNETLQKMFDDPTFFVSVVLNHVIQGVYPSVLLSDGEVIKAIAGNLTVSVDGDTIMFNDATVLLPNVLAINGIVHGIDTVFVPDIPVESPFPTYSGMPAMAPAVDAGMPTMAPAVDAGMPVTTPGLSPLTPPVDPDPTPMPVMAPVLREPTPPTSGVPYYGMVLATVTAVLVAVVM